MHAISYVCIHIPCAPPPQPCRDYIFGWSRRARRGCPSFVLSSRLVTYSSARLTACTTGTYNIAVGSGWGHCLPCPVLPCPAFFCRCVYRRVGWNAIEIRWPMPCDGWLAGWLAIWPSGSVPFVEFQAFADYHLLYSVISRETVRRGSQ